MPEVYDRFLNPALFAPHAHELARRAAALAPRRILELAAGTGALTSQLVSLLPDSSVTATDLNQAMVDHGAAKVEGATWRPADAQRLPFEDGSFDLVVCQFGVGFFPDKQSAFREVARVLRPGDRFLFNTWDVVERHDFAAALVAGVTKAFPIDPPTFVVRVPHGYADIAEVSADLVAAGLEVEDAVSVCVQGHADSAAQLAFGFCYGTPLRMEIERRDNLGRTYEVIAREMTARLGEGRVVGDLNAHLVTARAPWHGRGSPT